MRKEDIDIRLHDNRVLSISGERRAERTEQGERWHRTERSYGSFHRAFRLPENADLDKISAACEHGVLTVTVPKKPTPPEKEAKRIDVQ